MGRSAAAHVVAKAASVFTEAAAAAAEHVADHCRRRRRRAAAAAAASPCESSRQHLDQQRESQRERRAARSDTSADCGVWVRQPTEAAAGAGAGAEGVESEEVKAEWQDAGEAQRGERATREEKEVTRCVCRSTAAAAAAVDAATVCPGGAARGQLFFLSPRHVLWDLLPGARDDAAAERANKLYLHHRVSSSRRDGVEEQQREGC